MSKIHTLLIKILFLFVFFQIGCEREIRFETIDIKTTLADCDFGSGYANGQQFTGFKEFLSQDCQAVSNKVSLRCENKTILSANANEDVAKLYPFCIKDECKAQAGSATGSSINFVVFTSESNSGEPRIPPGYTFTVPRANSNYTAQGTCPLNTVDLVWTPADGNPKTAPSKCACQPTQGCNPPNVTDAGGKCGPCDTVNGLGYDSETKKCENCASRGKRLNPLTKTCDSSNPQSCSFSYTGETSPTNVAVGSSLTANQAPFVISTAECKQETRTCQTTSTGSSLTGSFSFRSCSKCQAGQQVIGNQCSSGSTSSNTFTLSFLGTGSGKVEFTSPANLPACESTSTSPCTQTLTTTTTVSLSQTPNTDNIFAGWSGGVAGCNNNSTTKTCSVSMSSPQTVVASFTLCGDGSAPNGDKTTCAVCVPGKGEKTNGQCDDCSTGQYTQNGKCTACTGLPAAHAQWAGVGTRANDPTSCPIQCTDGYSDSTTGGGKCSVPPTAETNNLNLTVNGTGTIRFPNAQNAETTCSSGLCTHAYPKTTTAVNLTMVAPGTDYIFAGWANGTGGCTTGTATSCTVSMATPQNVTATFSKCGSGQIPDTTTICKTCGAGTGESTPGTCTACATGKYTNNGVCDNCTKPQNSDFTGPGTTTADSCPIRCTNNYTPAGVCTTPPVPSSFKLTINSGTGGQVSYNPSPSGGSSVCSGNTPCTADYPSGSSSPTTVNLNASPTNPDSYFSGWSGACSGNTNPCTLTMSDNRTATASFANCAANSIPNSAKNGCQSCGTGQSESTTSSGTCTTTALPSTPVKLFIGLEFEKEVYKKGDAITGNIFLDSNFRFSGELLFWGIHDGGIFRMPQAGSQTVIFNIGRTPTTFKQINNDTDIVASNEGINLWNGKIAGGANKSYQVTRRVPVTASGSTGPYSFGAGIELNSQTYFQNDEVSGSLIATSSKSFNDCTIHVMVTGPENCATPNPVPLVNQWHYNQTVSTYNTWPLTGLLSPLNTPLKPGCAGAVYTLTVTLMRFPPFPTSDPDFEVKLEYDIIPQAR